MPATHHPVATHLAERLRLTDVDDSPLGTEDAAAFAEEVLISCRLRISEHELVAEVQEKLWHAFRSTPKYNISKN
jgi:hypothetical protein